MTTRANPRTTARRIHQALDPQTWDAGQKIHADGGTLISMFLCRDVFGLAWKCATTIFVLLRGKTTSTGAFLLC